MTTDYFPASHDADTSVDPLGLGGGTGYPELDNRPPAPDVTPQRDSSSPVAPAPDSLLSSPPPPPAAETPPPPADAVEPPKALEEKYADLDAYIESKFGVSLAEALESVNELNQFRQQATVEKQQAILKNEWGMEYENNMKVVMEKFQKLSPQEQAVYDNVNGARRLYAEYVYQNPQNTRGYNQPARLRSDVTTDKPYDFKQSEILAMSPKEYHDRQREITDAYTRGRVFRDA